LLEYQTGIAAAGGDKTTVARLQTGNEPGKVKDRILSPEPEEATTVQGLLSEVRLFRIHLQTTGCQGPWKDHAWFYAGNQSAEYLPHYGRVV
jgi:hypothetical protein